MKRLVRAPNLALATLWADQLTVAGYEATVQRAYASGIVGHIPPDQALPEVWIEDERQYDAALALLAELQHPPQRQWRCAACGESVEGGFGQCWNCGAWPPAD